MIGEIVAGSVQVNSERIGRESAVEFDRLQQKQEPEAEQQAQGFSDVTNFSSEAIALSRGVTETSGSAEQQEPEPADQSQPPQQAQNLARKSLDIMA